MVAPGVVDPRAVAALADADPPVVAGWGAVTGLAGAPVPPAGLAAGERPAADVEVLAAMAASAEYCLAVRLHAAAVAGALPLPTGAGVLGARGWSTGTARRLARAAALAANHDGLGQVWAAGVVTSEHLDPIARRAEQFTAEELAALVGELAPLWGQLSPAGVARFVTAAERLLHPPADPAPSEADAHTARDLSFAVLGDSVVLSGTLPRVEGELVIAAIDALAERLRSTADHVPAGARRADALVQLVNDAHAAGVLPTRGGLPVALTVTVQHTSAGDPIWSTSRGHQLTPAEARWAGCDATLTPILVGDHDEVCVVVPPGTPLTPAARIAALARALFDTRIPLAVGRSERTATPAQRRALAVRDGGCIIPGCGVPAEAAQIHHLTEWADGGCTDLANLATLCWAHHRQVDLRMWTLTPVAPGQHPPPEPEPCAPPGTPWPANNGAPFTVARTPRHTWRL